MTTQSECAKTGCSVYHDGKDVKRVQMRSQATGPGGPNKFDGPIVMMCAGCRKSNRGSVKMAPFPERNDFGTGGGYW